MRELKKYQLNFERTVDYFIASIKVNNALSKKVLESVQFEKGQFYGFFPNYVQKNRHYQFKYSLLSNCETRDYTLKFIFEQMKSHNENICIFDDTISNFEEGIEDPLFYKFGRFFKNEVYSVIDASNLSIEFVEKAYNYSDVLWHSLGVLSQSNITSKPGAQTSLKEIESICKNAKYIFVTAYDGEGCIFWEKT